MLDVKYFNYPKENKENECEIYFNGITKFEAFLDLRISNFFSYF